MIKIKHILAVMAMLILSAVPALAAEGLEGSVTGGVEFFGGDFNRAKFNEYRVEREGPWGGFVSADVSYAKPDSNHAYNFSLDYRSLEDIDMNFDTVSYGEYRFFVKYQRMGHTFATDVKSLYDGDGTGHLTIPAALRQELVNGLTGTFTTRLQDAVANAHTIDLFLIRDRVSTGLDWMVWKPVTLYTVFDYEHREGDRPYGATFSTSNAMEVPEPINYDTYNVKTGVEFAGKPIYADVSYNHSTFNNNIQSLTFDNLRQVAGAVDGSNPDRGRTSLAPSNSFDSVNVVLAKNLPLRSRLVFNFNYGWLSQDEALLPPTINPAAAPANTTAVLPRGTADASVNTMSFDVKATSNPIDKLEMKAGFRYYQHVNHTDTTTFPSTPNDTTDDLDTELTEYMSWITREVNAEVSYEVFRRTHFGIGWSNLNESYRNATANAESQNTYKLFMDTRALDYLTARLSFEYSNRDSWYRDDPDYFLTRKFYQADRDRSRVNALVTVSPTDSLAVSLNYMFDDTEYSNSKFGMQDVFGHTAGIDADYQPVWWLGMNMFYTYEYDRIRQFEHRTNQDWALKNVTETNTVGAGVNLGIIKDRLNFKVDVSYSDVAGDATFASNTTLLPWNNVDSPTLTKIGTTFKYKATKALELSLGYGYERWTIKDYQYNGVTDVVVDTTNTYRGLLTMNSLYKPYEVHTVFASATYRF